MLFRSGGGPRYGVQFASTIIYPGGGGQHADRGSFRILGNKDTRAPRKPATEAATQPITGVFRDGSELWYLTEKLAPLPGTAVRLAIDWDRRYALMRTHTSMHILIGVIWRDYKKLVTGSNMELLKARLDFEFEGLGPSLLAEIEERANLEIKAARPVRVTFADADSSVDGLIRTKTNLVPTDIARLRFVEIGRAHV